MLKKHLNKARLSKKIKYRTITLVLILTSFANQVTANTYSLFSTRPLSKECKPNSEHQPPWLKKIINPSTITDKFWYKNWLNTTNDLCTDLSKIKLMNPSRKYLEWRSDRIPLFSLLIPEGTTITDAFTNGLVPKLSGDEMSFPVSAFPTSYILTWYQPSLAFANFTKGPTPDWNHVLVIDAPGGINRDKISASEEAHQGVLFPGGIKSTYIKGVFRMTQNDLGTSYKATYYPNARYYGSAPDVDHFDLIATPMNPVNDSVFPKAQIDVSPKGERIGELTFRHPKGIDITLKLRNSAPQCWYVNGTQESEKMESFVYKAKNQTSELAVIYPGLCKLKRIHTDKI